jgi:elongation factor G
MDGVAWYLPSPAEVPAVEGVNPEKKDRKEKRQTDPKEPFAGLVFKIASTKYGETYFVRVYSGTLKANSRVWNPVRQVKEFASKLYRIHPDPRVRDEELPAAHAGDIIGIVGPKESITGDTLCDQRHPVVLEQIKFAEAVVSRSIEPQSSADKDKLTDTLNRLQKEDPTFKWHLDSDTGQMLMTGMGLLHLEVKQHVMERDYNLRIRVGQPRVSYRETLRGPVTVEGECHKQAGTASLWAKVTVRFEPARGEQAVTVGSTVPPDTLPPLLLDAAEQGIRGALQSGELGYPVIGVRATLLGGQLDQQFSNEVAFQVAGADAVHRAMRNNNSLLEPVMRLEVVIPEEFLGAVISDLNARRADITETVVRGKLQQIEALVPLARMFDYSDKVRSLTQGRASWTMEPHSYREVPPDVLRGMLGEDEY